MKIPTPPRKWSSRADRWQQISLLSSRERILLALEASRRALTQHKSDLLTEIDEELALTIDDPTRTEHRPNVQIGPDTRFRHLESVFGRKLSRPKAVEHLPYIYYNRIAEATHYLISTLSKRKRPTTDPTHNLNLQELITQVSEHTSYQALHQLDKGYGRRTRRVLRLMFQHIHGPIDRQFDPNLRNDTTTALAREVKASRDLTLLPILADALQDAGCNDEDTLHQLRHEPEGQSASSWIIRRLLSQPE